MKKQAIRISKRNLNNQETWQYTGHVLAQDAHSITVEAYFNRPDMPFHEIVLKRNDRFVEVFYLDRWYNVFAMHDRDDGSLKGWYCNITKPAVIENPEGEVPTLAYVDLELDLLVYPPDSEHPSGRQLVLDEAEFEALALDPDQRQQALQALEEVKERFSGGTFNA